MTTCRCKKPSDKFYTPEELAKDLINRVEGKFAAGDIVLDPCRGKGARFPSALIGVGVEPPKMISGSVLYKLTENRGAE